MLGQVQQVDREDRERHDDDGRRQPPNETLHPAQEANCGRPDRQGRTRPAADVRKGPDDDLEGVFPEGFGIPTSFGS